MDTSKYETSNLLILCHTMTPPRSGPESTFVRSSFHLYSHIISKGDDCGEKKQIPTGHCRKAPQVQEVSEKVFCSHRFFRKAETLAMMMV